MLHSTARLLWAHSSRASLLFQSARPFSRHIASRASPAMAEASLSFWERAPPYAAAALARLGEVSLLLVADSKATKDTVPSLSVAG
jgi:hypothetical protein